VAVRFLTREQVAEELNIS